MKKSIRDCFVIVFIALLVSIFIFAFVYTRELALVSFTSFLLISIFIASLFLMSYLHLVCDDKCHHRPNAFCHCGHLATIGAAGVILTGLFLALSSTFSILSALIIASFFFFFFLLLAGSIRFMHTLLRCDQNCLEEDKPPIHSHQNNPTKRYEHHYPNDRR